MNELQYFKIPKGTILVSFKGDNEIKEKLTEKQNEEYFSILEAKRGEHTLKVKVAHRERKSWESNPKLMCSSIIRNKKGEQVYSNSDYWNSDYKKYVQSELKSLSRFPTDQETKSGLNSIRAVLSNVFPENGYFRYEGVTGTLKQYYHRPCVISFVSNGNVCVGVYKTARKYKGFYATCHDHRYLYERKIVDIDVNEAIENMKKVKETKIVFKDIPEEDHMKIICNKL